MRRVMHVTQRDLPRSANRYQCEFPGLKVRRTGSFDSDLRRIASLRDFDDRLIRHTYNLQKHLPHHWIQRIKLSRIFCSHVRLHGLDVFGASGFYKGHYHLSLRLVSSLCSFGSRRPALCGFTCRCRWLLARVFACCDYRRALDCRRESCL